MQERGQTGKTPRLALTGGLRQCGGMKLCVHELPGMRAGQVTSPPRPRAAAGRPRRRSARAVWLGGLAAPVPLCSGLGRCGRCRVRFHDLSVAPDPLPEEEEILGPSLLAEGWRLACRRQITDVMGPELHLDVPAPEKMTVTTTAASSLPAQAPLALAVDLGTTSLYWRLLAVPDAREAQAPDDFPCSAVRPLPVSVVAEGHDLNPQAGAGADIMSRLAVASAPEGRARLARLVRDHLAALLRQQTASLPGIPVERLVLAANTAMTDIFLDRDISGLCAAPYRRSHAGGCGLTVEGLPPLLIPPLPAPFVGGDISAGLLRLLAGSLPRPLLLADLGTNGELALVDAQGHLWLASVPLGPALEGIGPQCGRMAGRGASPASRSRPGPGLPRCGRPLAAGAHVQGISATGYLSLLALLLRLGCLDADGHFRTPASPLARRVAPPPQQTRTGLRLPPAVRAMAGRRRRGGTAQGQGRLLTGPGGPAAGGGTGRGRCGLSGPGRRPGRALSARLSGRAGLSALRHGAACTGRGQQFLDGAALLAADPWRLPALARWCATATLVPVAEDPGFHADYLRHMRFGV